MDGTEDLADSAEASTEGRAARGASVESLEQLAEDKAELLMQQMVTSLETTGHVDCSGFHDARVPVASVLDSEFWTHVYPRSDASGPVLESVTKHTHRFCYQVRSVPVVESAGRLLGESARRFLGNTAKSNLTMTDFCTMLERSHVIRLDFLAWQLDVEAMGVSGAQEVCAFVFVRSAVDLAKVEFGRWVGAHPWWSKGGIGYIEQSLGGDGFREARRLRSEDFDRARRYFDNFNEAFERGEEWAMEHARPSVSGAVDDDG